MGASVWIVVFLTLSQYMAVCRPFYQGFLRKRRMCVWLVVLSYAFSFCIYAPWATKKAVHVVISDIVSPLLYIVKVSPVLLNVSGKLRLYIRAFKN